MEEPVKQKAVRKSKTASKPVVKSFEQKQLEEQTRVMKKMVNASYLVPISNNPLEINPWIVQTDTLDSNKSQTYKDIVKECRFFYRKDPIIGTAINKMVEVGVNEIKFYKNGLSDNEFKVFTALKSKFQEFAEAMALEYLLSGLVVPEISYGPVDKETLNEYGIKKYVGGLTLPTSMWLRDPDTVKINAVIPDQPSFYVVIPETLIYFIKNKGEYKDGTKDLVLYKKLLKDFPEFVRKVMADEKEILLDNKLIFRRKVLSDSPYPTPFISLAIEALKHKRNLRRMDYSIASRAIGAIQLFNLGNDEYPITEDNQGDFDDIKAQMYYRNGRSQMDIERIFQLFANHTLKISWVYPPLDALLNDRKYAEVNSDIIFSLGFPQVLITGEATKSGTSSAEFAVMSPAKTMESFRSKILEVLRHVLRQVAELNDFKSEPKIVFKPINLTPYADFLTAMRDLYSTGNLSRTEYAEELGFDWNDSQDLREEENKTLKDKGLEDINAKPFSAPGNVPGGNENNPQNKPENQKKPVTTNTPTAKKPVVK